MVKKNTLEKLKNNICFCLKRDKDIPIIECEAGDCKRFKSCMQKSNRELDKEMSKNG